MDISNQVLESMERVREIPLIYNGGITASVNAIVWFSDRYLYNPHNIQYKPFVDSYFDQIKKLFEIIPFHIIPGETVTYPLSSIKDLLPKFETQIHYIFEGNKREAIRQLTEIASAIISYEKRYFKNLDENLDLLFAGFAETL